MLPQRICEVVEASRATGTAPTRRRLVILANQPTRGWSNTPIADPSKRGVHRRRRLYKKILKSSLTTNALAVGRPATSMHAADAEVLQTVTEFASQARRKKGAAEINVRLGTVIRDLDARLKPTGRLLPGTRLRRCAVPLVAARLEKKTRRRCPRVWRQPLNRAVGCTFRGKRPAYLATGARPARQSRAARPSSLILRKPTKACTRCCVEVSAKSQTRPVDIAFAPPGAGVHVARATWRAPDVFVPKRRRKPRAVADPRRVESSAAATTSPCRLSPRSSRSRPAQNAVARLRLAERTPKQAIQSSMSWRTRVGRRLRCRAVGLHEFTMLVPSHLVALIARRNLRDGGPNPLCTSAGAASPTRFEFGSRPEALFLSEDLVAPSVEPAPTSIVSAARW